MQNFAGGTLLNVGKLLGREIISFLFPGAVAEKSEKLRCMELSILEARYQEFTLLEILFDLMKS